MFDFTKPNIEILEISEDKRFGRFVCEPLERGYGSTLGNSLRRMMLSSLPGAAISAIKIENLSGDKVSGIQESFPELLTNLKSIAVILPEEVESLEVSVDLSGKSEILAEDFITDIANVEIEGSGDVNIYTKETFSGTIKGSGDIVVKGNPDQVSQSIKGTGEIQIL